MNNYQNDLWLSAIQNAEDKTLGEAMQPKFKFSNTARGQCGSLFPKLLYFYGCMEKEFLIEAPQQTEGYLISAAEGLAPYYDFEIGYHSRSVDRDNISPYPYLHIDNQDYFVTHNIETDYAGEDLLRLIRQQLKNLNRSHCFTARILASGSNAAPSGHRWLR